MLDSPDEMQPLKAKIQSALTSGRLNDWEVRFLTEMDARIDRYGRKARFSEKQTSKLYQILQGSAHRPQQGSASISYRTPRRRQSVGRLVSREWRWRARRLIRGAFSICILAVVFAHYAISLYSGRPERGHEDVLAVPAYSANPILRSDFTVTDGDTIHIDGQSRGMRLVGLNAPETWQPQCPEEKALGERAKARLRQLVSSATLEVQRVPCSCPPGTEGTDECNYGRSCGILRANGRDVGQILIAEGLAVPFVCGATRCPKTPRPWCG
jgi:endonuclease YncB( thermonuclease family)